MVPKSVMNTSQMNGLYPIIRRVRRPLLPTDAVDAKPLEALKEEGERKAEHSQVIPRKPEDEAVQDSDERS